MCMSLWSLLGEEPVVQLAGEYIPYHQLLAALHAPCTSEDSDRQALQLLAATGASSVGGARGDVALSHDADLLLQAALRARQFVGLHLELQWARLLDAVAALRALRALGGPCSRAGSSGLAGIRSSLDFIGEELIRLDTYLSHNTAICASLAQHLDRTQETAAVAGEYQTAARRCLLGALSPDTVMVGLSDAYELLCALDAGVVGSEAGPREKPAVWVPPSSFQRKTRKFWLHVSDVAAFKIGVLKHLPVLVFGERKRITEEDLSRHRPPLSAYSGVDDSSLVTSVYLDSVAQGLPSYHERLRRVDGATAVRIRWYGKRSSSGDQQLFVEKKVHRAAFTGELSFKERAALQQRDIVAFLSGSSAYTAGSPEDAAFLTDTQQHVLSPGVAGTAPLLRTCYRRIAFQRSTDNAVRISLDVDLHMVGEVGAPRDPGDWCRAEDAPHLPHDAVRFPYAVVEVKLGQDIKSKPPAWIKELVASGVLLRVPKFSKFLHGTSVLYQPLTANTPQWFLPDQKDPHIMTPATFEEIKEAEGEKEEGAWSWLFPAPLDDNITTEAAGAGTQSDRPDQESQESLSGSPAHGSSLALCPCTPPPGSEHNGPVDMGSKASAASLPPLRVKEGAQRGSGASTPRDSVEDVEEGHASPKGRSLKGVPPTVLAGASTGADGMPPAILDLESGMHMPPKGWESSTTSGQPKGRSASMVRKRVEPKTFFSNERTFLQWLQIAVLVMFTALSLLSSAASSSPQGRGCSDARCVASKVSGVIIAPAGLLLMAYALLMYKKRTIQILSRQNVRYDDQRGPVALVAILIGVMVVSYVLALVWIF